MELSTPPKFLSVFIPLLQSHSPLCSFTSIIKQPLILSPFSTQEVEVVGIDVNG